MKRSFSVIFLVGFLLLGFSVPAIAGGDSTLPSGTRAAALAGPCGSSYSHIGHYPIKSDSGVTVAHLDVYWSGSAKRNCLVTNHYGPTYGVLLYTQAMIRPSGWSWPSCPSSVGCDGGHYRYYAGPVYTPAGVDMSDRCIDISGDIDWAARTLTNLHCG